MDGTTAVRLRAGRVRSAVVRLRVQPTWTTSATPGDPAVVSGTAAGGRAGDAVLLRTPLHLRAVGAVAVRSAP